MLSLKAVFGVQYHFPMRTDADGHGAGGRRADTRCTADTGCHTHKHTNTRTRHGRTSQGGGPS